MTDESVGCRISTGKGVTLLEGTYYQTLWRNEFTGETVFLFSPTEYHPQTRDGLIRCRGKVGVYYYRLPLRLSGEFKDGEYSVTSAEVSSEGQTGKMLDYFFEGTGESVSLPLEALRESPFNNFELTDIEEMKSSILSVGLITPLSVARPDEMGAYEILSGGRRFQAISDRYSRMYRQVFDHAGDSLKELSCSGNIRINDVSRLSSLPEEDQEAAAEKVKKAKNAKDKADIVSRYTAKSNRKTEEALDNAECPSRGVRPGRIRRRRKSGKTCLQGGRDCP